MHTRDHFVCFKIFWLAAQQTCFDSVWSISHHTMNFSDVWDCLRFLPVRLDCVVFLDVFLRNPEYISALHVYLRQLKIKKLVISHASVEMVKQTYFNSYHQIPTS